MSSGDRKYQDTLNNLGKVELLLQEACAVIADARITLHHMCDNYVMEQQRLQERFDDLQDRFEILEQESFQASGNRDDC